MINKTTCLFCGNKIEYEKNDAILECQRCHKKYRFDKSGTLINDTGKPIVPKEKSVIKRVMKKVFPSEQEKLLAKDEKMQTEMDEEIAEQESKSEQDYEPIAEIIDDESLDFMAKALKFLDKQTEQIESISINGANNKSYLKHFKIANNTVTKFIFKPFLSSELREVIIPSGVKTIGSNAFMGGDRLTSVHFPSTVTAIESGAFSKCENLFTITIPTNIKSIGENAFADCPRLRNVILHDKIEFIGEDAFANNPSINFYILGENESDIINSLCKSDYNEVKYGYYGCAEEDNMIYYLTKDGASAYSLLNDIKNVHISHDIEYFGKYITVTEISAGCFLGKSYPDTTLMSVIIPSETKRIGKRAFALCRRLKDIILPLNLTSIDSGAFESCNGLDNIHMPDSITFIGANAFFSCENLKNLTFSKNLTTISDGAFSFCNSLAEIEIPKNIKKIDKNAFSYCNDLKQVALFDGLQNINDCAFAYCPNLNEITIPKTVTNLSETAFFESINLEKVTFSSKEHADLVGDTWQKNSSIAYTRQPENENGEIVYVIEK